MQYHIQKLTDPEHPGTPHLLDAVHQQLADQTDSSVFGIFTSLLRLASNELYLVTAGEVSLDEHANLKIVETDANDLFLDPQLSVVQASSSPENPVEPYEFTIGVRLRPVVKDSDDYEQFMDDGGLNDAE